MHSTSQLHISQKVPGGEARGKVQNHKSAGAFPSIFRSNGFMRIIEGSTEGEVIFNGQLMTMAGAIRNHFASSDDSKSNTVWEALPP